MPEEEPCIPPLSLIQNLSVTYQQRLSRTNQWTDSLKDISKKLSGEPKEEATEALTLLREQGQFCRPIISPHTEEWGISRFGDVPFEQSVGIVALFGSDTQLHPVFKWLVKNGLSYYENTRTIFIPPRRVSPVWRGLLMGHELKHAKYHLNGEFRDLEDGHWAEEVDAYRSEAAMASQIYGEPYDELIDLATQKIRHDINKGRETNATFLSSIDNDAITEVMGEPASRFERGSRYGLVHLHAIYQAFDILGRKDHAAITKWFCG